MEVPRLTCKAFAYRRLCQAMRRLPENGLAADVSPISYPSDGPSKEVPLRNGICDKDPKEVDFKELSQCNQVGHLEPPDLLFFPKS